MLFTGAYIQQGPHSAVLDALKVLCQAGCPESRREAIGALETVMAQFPQVEQPVTHHFTEGQYAREIFNPRHSLIVTKTHKQGNVSFIPKGRLLVITEEGQKELTGGMWFTTKPGTKRVIFALEDTQFVTVHPNPDNCTDLEVLETRIIQGAA